MKALGFIETRGLVPAIESADAMLKAAEVTLVERTFVKGGLVTITIWAEKSSPHMLFLVLMKLWMVSSSSTSKMTMKRRMIRRLA